MALWGGLAPSHSGAKLQRSVSSVSPSLCRERVAAALAMVASILPR